MLFVHGATYGSRLYDIAVPGMSWIEAASGAGFAAYALDIRGYGKSRSAAVARPSEPYARSSDAICDIADAMDFLLRRHGVDRLALVGGSWGSITTALYTSTIGRDLVERLVLFAPIFRASNEGWHKLLADPADPARFDPRFGAFRLVDEAGTRSRWDAEIPPGDPWRDEAVLAALLGGSFADDPGAATRAPMAFEAPNGALADLWDAYGGRPIYNPAAIACPVLMMRGSADRTSTRADALDLFDSLASPNKHYLELSGGSHFMFAERRAPQVFAAANSFLSTGFGNA